MSDVITLITAPAGSGKSFTRTRQLVDEILPDSGAHYYTNLPVFPEVIAEYLAEKTGRSAEEFEQRIHVIPPEECERWRTLESGPWEYFEHIDLRDAWLVLDECHEFISQKHRPTHKKYWQKFLGQIRHRGCRVQLISQHFNKIAKVVHDEAGLRVELVNVEAARDPFFRVRMGDWYELYASWVTKAIRPTIWEVERRQVDGKWKVTDTKRYRLEPHYFQFYDSYSSPEMGGVKVEAPKREFEKRSRAGLTAWFLRRNWWRLGRSLGFAALVCCLPWVLPPSINFAMGSINRLAGKGDTTERGSEKVERTGGSTTFSPPPSPALPSPAAAVDSKRRPMLPPGMVPADQLIAITDDEAVFQTCGRLRLGEKIDAGTFEGKTVAAIDWRRRAVVLDDGTVVRIDGGDVLQDWQNGRRDKSSDALPRPLRRNVSGPREKPVAGDEQPAGDAQLQGDVNGGVFAPAGGQVPGEHRVGRKLR